MEVALIHVLSIVEHLAVQHVEVVLVVEVHVPVLAELLVILHAGDVAGALDVIVDVQAVVVDVEPDVELVAVDAEVHVVDAPVVEIRAVVVVGHRVHQVVLVAMDARIRV